jgi:hypothetical protein
MGKKLIITEQQYNRIFAHIISEGDYDVILGRVLDDLNKNYEKVSAVVKGYHDYNESPMIRVKVDDSIIKPNDLLEYLKYSYHGVCGDEFLKQVIDDWYHNRVVDGNLTKNVQLK